MIRSSIGSCRLLFMGCREIGKANPFRYCVSNQQQRGLGTRLYCTADAVRMDDAAAADSALRVRRLGTPLPSPNARLRARATPSPARGVLHLNTPSATFSLP